MQERREKAQPHREPDADESAAIKARSVHLRVDDKPAKAAAGLPAVLKSMDFANRELGLVDGTRVLLNLNQPTGFDCPGCAWPDPADRHTAEFCENGAKAVSHEGTHRRVDAAFFAEHSIAALRKQTDYELEQNGRLTTPMLLEEGASHYKEIRWSEAFDLVADALCACSSPDEAIFYTSGRTSNEAAFLYQLMVRAYGTNNLPDCSNMCHESSGAGLSSTIGIGKGTVSLEDFQKADAIFVMGQNPGTNHPRMLTSLEQAKRNGAKIVAVNPLKEKALERFSNPQEPLALLGKSTKISDLFLQVRIGGDQALLHGMMKIVLADDKNLDAAFIAAHTSGLEALREAVDQSDWETIEAQSGLSRGQIEEAAKIYLESERTIICWAMGLTQHKHSVATIQDVVNLLLLRGNMGREGAGACPVRGHSNVQGDRTMGIWEAPKDAFLDRMEEVFGFHPPREHGYAVVHAIEAMEKSAAKVFFAMGGNFVSATPDTPRTMAALENMDLTVQVSTKLNRSHLYGGKRALIFPCLGRTEIDLQPRRGDDVTERDDGTAQFVTVENSMGVVHRSEGHRPPASEALLSEPRIVAEVARRLVDRLEGGACAFENRTIPKDHRLPNFDALASDYSKIRDAIEQVIPGFEAYNERVADDLGFELPNNARARDFSPVGGRAKFTAHQLPSLVLEEDELWLMTMRSHDQYNTTVYGLDDRYRGVYGHREIVFMHRKDLDARGIKNRDLVAVTSRFPGEGGRVERRVENFVALAYDIPRGCVAMYFPEANPLVPLESRADKSHTPTSKSVPVVIEKMSA